MSATEADPPARATANPVPGRRATTVLDGGLRGVLAESLFMPTGLIAVVYLARRLGAEGYGLFALAFAFIAPIEWLLSAPFTATTAGAVRAAADWRAVGLALAHRRALGGLRVAACLFVLAPWLAALLAVPDLTPALRLFALDLPLFTLAQGYRDILIGRGLLRARALSNATRMLARPILIVACVEAGLGVAGAILGTIGVSVVQIVVCKGAIRGPLWPSLSRGGRALPAMPRADALGGFGLRLFERLDLLALAFFGGFATATLAQGGLYATAQFLTLLPGTVALAFVPQLEAALRRQVRDGECEAARVLARDGLRAALAVWPFAALAAGAAPRLVVFLFGQPYAPAATPLMLLIVAAAASILLLVSLTILTIFGRAEIAAALVGVLLVFAGVGFWLAIPARGNTGAALVVAIVAAGGALAGVALAAYRWRIVPPGASILRAVVLAAIAYLLARWWEVPLVLLPLQLALLGGIIACGFVVSGEWPWRALLAHRKSFAGN